VRRADLAANPASTGVRPLPEPARWIIGVTALGVEDFRALAVHRSDEAHS
jgi:hypothetical protein